MNMFKNIQIIKKHAKKHIKRFVILKINIFTLTLS